MRRGRHGPIGTLVAFTVLEGEDSDAWDFAYEWLRDDLIERAKRLFPSLEPYDGWRDREDHILAHYAFADFGVSAYGGVVAVWIR